MTWGYENIVETHTQGQAEEALMILQEGRCAVCGDDLDLVQWVTDHCHASGYVRALLCHSCNTREGFSSPGTDWAAFRANPPARQAGIYTFYRNCYGTIPVREEPCTEAEHRAAVDRFAEAVWGSVPRAHRQVDA